MQIKTIGDIAEFVRTGKTPPSKEKKYFDGSISWYTPGDFGDQKFLNGSSRTITPLAFEENKAVVFPSETLLITCIGNIGKIGITNTTSSSNQQITAIKPKKKINVHYLYYWFLNNKSLLGDMANNAVVPILNNKVLKTIPFQYPILKFQKKIVAILDEADNLRRLNQELIERYEELILSCFLEIFGDPVTNPKNWEKKPLNALGKVKTGATPSGKKENMYGTTIPFITPGDLETYKPVKRFLTEEGAENSRVVPKDSLLICCIGTIGKRGIAKEKSAFNQQINAVIWNEEINPFFGYYSFNWIKHEVKQKAFSTTLPILKKSEFEKIQLITPPKEVQDRFGKIVENIVEQKAQAQQALEQSEKLFGSLLQRAFKGELV